MSEQLPSPFQAAKFVLASVEEFDAGADDQVFDGAGYEDFAGTRLPHHSGSCVDCYAADVVTSQFDLASMQA